MACATESELSCGLMAAGMKDNGETTRRTDRANLSMLMVTSTRANGWTTRLKEWAHTHTQTALTTKDSGSTISSTAKVSNPGPMALGMKANTRMERRKGKEDSPLQMAAIMRAPLSIMKSAVSDTTSGLMASHTPATGAKTKWMARASLSGRTESSTRASSWMISARDMALSCGLMAANISASGKQENSTESAPTSVRKASKNRASGKMDAKSNGLATRSATMRRKMSNNIDFSYSLVLSTGS